MQSLFNAAALGEAPQYVPPTIGYDALQQYPAQGAIEVSSKKSKILPIVAILILVIVAAFFANKKFNFVDTKKLQKNLPKYKKTVTEYVSNMFSGGKKGKVKMGGRP